MTTGRTKVTGQRFEMLSDHELGPRLCDVVLEDCVFMACHYGNTAKSPADRRCVQNVDVVNCRTTSNCSLGPVVLESVSVNGLKTGGVCIAWGAVYRHVTLAGRCGKLFLNQPRPGEKEGAFLKANEKFYGGIDWALDISAGQFEELDIRGIPADLIRRDPETQVVVRLDRVKMLQAEWQKLDLEGTPWAVSLSNMIQLGLKDKVLVAPTARKDASRWLKGLHLLRAAGVADPT